MTAITPADVKYRLAAATGPGNSAAAGSTGSSLGRFMSTTDLTTTNIFPPVSGPDNAAMKSDYQVVFIFNTVASASNATGMQNVTVSISNVSGGADASFGVDPTGIVDGNSASAQTVAAPADRYTAPAGVTFGTAPLSLGTIGPLKCIAVWIKRTPTNSGAMSGDGITLSVVWDTSA